MGSWCQGGEGKDSLGRVELRVWFQSTRGHFLGIRELVLAGGMQCWLQVREREPRHVRVWMLWPTASESNAWMYS